LNNDVRGATKSCKETNGPPLEPMPHLGGIAIINCKYAAETSKREAKDSPLENQERSICNKGRIEWAFAVRDEEWFLKPRVNLQGTGGINRDSKRDNR
jgi:hypothetical protein